MIIVYFSRNDTISHSPSGNVCEKTCINHIAYKHITHILPKIMKKEGIFMSYSSMRV